MFEHFHIDFAKEGWRVSNFRDELPQMTHWLERQEKVATFETYLDHFEGEQDGVVAAAANTHNSTPLRIILPKKPAHVNQTLVSIQKNHRCPSFSHQLRIYLNSLLNKTDALPRANISSTYLLFDKINVWHGFKFGRNILGNNVESTEEKDWVRAKPARQQGLGGERFDTVVVSHTDEAQSTGMKGMKVGRLRVIFTLPEILRNCTKSSQFQMLFSRATNCFTLAKVELFQRSGGADASGVASATGEYIVQVALRRAWFNISPNGLEEATSEV
ncbi:hypothetical protein AZE42_10127 [Rhizopogon vesiculosus]|uniref:Uncharacterized protein n=1 Tax=Rhizopogon vesiculosus TaxID=180088 RepID=A0A1J8QDW2_9AGAM|nr:hypothetical protein AZE42_10127 [Rhizopogon vesiculosus]